MKELTNIQNDVNLFLKSVLESILKLKLISNYITKSLNLEEVLIALSICSVTNSSLEKALKRLNINLTCDPIFYSNNLFMNE